MLKSQNTHRKKHKISVQIQNQSENLFYSTVKNICIEIFTIHVSKYKEVDKHCLLKPQFPRLHNVHDENLVWF